jgi:hypothetical protein
MMTVSAKEELAAKKQIWDLNDATQGFLWTSRKSPPTFLYPLPFEL